VPRVYQLAEYRRRRTLTQHELAKLADLSRPTIARMEAGHSVRQASIDRVARALKVRPEALH
jgi:predicted transcriptional regulator